MPPSESDAPAQPPAPLPTSAAPPGPPSVAGFQALPSVPAPPPPVDAFRTHPAFCQISLPASPGAATWRRDTPNLTVTLEAPAPLGGPLLRLLLLHIFESAAVTGNALVEMGTDAADLARRIGLQGDAAAVAELGQMYERLLTAKLAFAGEGAAPLSVFDARSRLKAPDWRPAIRLNARVLATLQEAPVRLDRRAVGAMLTQPAALDVYCWICNGIGPLPFEGDTAPLESWETLAQRFAQEGEAIEAFRTTFEETARLVTELAPDVSVLITETGISPRRPAPSLRAEALRERAPRPEHKPEPKPEPAAAQPAPRPERPRFENPRFENPRFEQPRGETQRVEPQREPQRFEPQRPEPPRFEPQRFEPQRYEPQRSEHRAEPAEAESDDSWNDAPGRNRPAISLRNNLTGLHQVIWLQRSHGRDLPLIEVTPGNRYDPDSVTLLALEPMVVQITGGLYERDFEKVAAWIMVNRDLIDDYWDGAVDGYEAVSARVRKVPAPTWR